MSREKVTTNEQFLNKLVEVQIPVEKQIQNLTSLEQKIANNDCGDDKDCKEEQYQLNRRTQFIVEKME